MRTKNSIYNIIGNVFSMFVQIILTFIIRIVFVKMLNEEFLGIQGLFTNIISMLTVAELGISTAISFALYKPLADGDNKKISQIVTLFRKVYFIIGWIVIGISLCLMPFLDNIVTNYHFGKLELIFSIYFIGLAIEYFIAYPEILISADQKRYKITFIYSLTYILCGVFQIIVLYVYKSFIIYILVDLLIRIIRFIFINVYVKKQYSKITFFSKEKLTKKEKREILANVKSLFLYKVGNYLINGTDNLIISKMINIVTVGIYNNYLSITTIFKNLMTNIINGTSSSFGNLLVKESKTVQKNTFNIMNFITFLISSFVFLCLYFLFDDFILLCFGSKFLLSNFEKIIICINFYIINMLLPVECVKNAAGIYTRDRYCSLLQAIINLTLSIILCKKYGLIGVLLGTTISYLFVTAWEKPYMIYKYLFSEKLANYIKDYIMKIIFICLNMIILFILFAKFSISNIFICLILKCIIIIIIFTLLCIICFRKKDEYKFVKKLIYKFLRRKDAKSSSN